MSNQTYQDYFAIDPTYYPVVTEKLIAENKVKWDSFYPHETFIHLLEKTHLMLSKKKIGSLWVEGAYGSGKSHAVWTLRSLLEASPEDINGYFAKYELRSDLCNKLIADKNAGTLLCAHREGSSEIISDQNLVYAIQESIVAALEAHHIENKGSSALRQSAIEWISSTDANKTYINSLIQSDAYSYEFGGMDVNMLLDELKDNTAKSTELMTKLLKLCDKEGIVALKLDVPRLCAWIKEVIEANHLSGIIFFWDEFTEYFKNNTALTGFQNLVEFSASEPFYFVIVTHESASLIRDDESRKKIIGRFIDSSTIRIELPENMAFRLMAQAMKTATDPTTRNTWEELKDELNEDLKDVRRFMIETAKKQNQRSGLISDEELKGIVPIHPYAALILKHMSVVFQSNARSMFDFIVNENESQGFKWFIRTYGPVSENNLLTVDMLWDFLTSKSQNDFTGEVRNVIGAYKLAQNKKLSPDQEKVYKTALLLEALSKRVDFVDLLRPNAQNIDFAFRGTAWPVGKAKNILQSLVKEKNVLFIRSLGKDEDEYTHVEGVGGIDPKRIKEIRDSLRTSDLVTKAGLELELPAAFKERFIVQNITKANIVSSIKRANVEAKPNRFQLFCGFAMLVDEFRDLQETVQKEVAKEHNDLVFVLSKKTMEDVSIDKYVEHLAFSEHFQQNDKNQSKNYAALAQSVLDEWKYNITQHSFILYSPQFPSGQIFHNLEALQEALRDMDLQEYPYSLERWNLTDSMFQRNNPAVGAECGITQELKQGYKSANANTSLSKHLEGLWKVERYWENPSLQKHPIVRLKCKVDELITTAFKEKGRVSLMDIYEALEEKPFGLMPNNVSSFILGFVLKEYVQSNYFWSNGSTSDGMSLPRMKVAIGNTISQKALPSNKYKEEFIVAMSENMRHFLACTTRVFHLDPSQCGSVESARDNIRIAMRKHSFPIWCLKYHPKTSSMASAKDVLDEVISAYSIIANTGNTKGLGSTESDWAERIGKLVASHESLIQDLVELVTSPNCQEGMLAYLKSYREGLLVRLASEIGDNGTYIDELKQRFSAEAANWVWAEETAQAKIDDVILDYQLIAESNKIIPQKKSLSDVVSEWKRRANNIPVPYEELKSLANVPRHMLESLKNISVHGKLIDQEKKAFYEALCQEGEEFDLFYKNKLSIFRKVNGSFLEGLEEEEVSTLCQEMETGQFPKSSDDYYQSLEKKVSDYKSSILRNQLNKLWRDKTRSNSPDEWSKTYKTPILCMFNDQERAKAKRHFDVFRSGGDEEIQLALDYLAGADFYERLNDAAERDRCFMERVVGDFSILLTNAEEVRQDLSLHLADDPYEWMDNSSVTNRLQEFATKKYKLGGKAKVLSVIDRMNDSQLRAYLSDLIAESLIVGIQILKKK